MNIEQRVKEIIVEQLGVDPAEVVDKAHLANDLGADSLDHIEIIMAMEEEFGTEIPDEEAEKLYVVSDLVKYVTDTVRKQK
jgi:acyl carrier protein